MAAIAGTTLRMSVPARAPIAKATSVQAANPIPRRSNRPGKNGVYSVRDRFWLAATKYGW